MKQTTKQLIDTYCKKYGIVLKKGDGAVFLLPFLTMIAALDIYTDKVKPMPMKGDAKYVRKMWADEYRKFERIMTYAFDLDHLSDIGDLTDGLEDYISHDMLILRCTIWNNMPINDGARKDRIIDGLLLNVLTQCSNVMWNDIYGEECQILTNLEHIALRMCDRLQPHLEASVFHHPQQVEDAVKVLCTKMINYLEEKIR